ncbi:MAG TPA: protein kinase [Kofleriaceae bacterium]|nr:protein kinase [Kofleriaceae bacterium]
MPADPADRTATLAPRDATPAPAPAPAPARDEADVEEGDLPVDDPERYEQVAEQGRGGLGRVVRAVDKRLGRTVAVKELLRNDDWHEARFVREALITARLEHPGIVPVHEAGRWPNGAPYYVMKLVEGRTLKELMAGHASWRERVELLPHIIAIADAVGYAHREGVIHRDLKPSNVIVGSFGETIVIDWGLARDCKRDIPEPQGDMAIATGSGVSTVSGKIVGTPAYMAPEQARGEPVDERADVYAIGAVLYELLAGKAPHADETPQSALDRVIAGPPAPLMHVAAGAPTELCDIVGKAMARDPRDRYANAKELAEDLRRFSTGKLVSAHAYTPWQIVGKKIKQHRGVVVVAAASAIALGAMGVESVRKVVAERDIAQTERTNAVKAQSDAERINSELVLVQAQTSLRKDPTASIAWLKRHKVHESDTATVVDVIDEALASGVARDVFRAGDWVFDAKFSPDGKTIVAAVRNGNLVVYDVETGAHRQIGKAPSAPEALAISPDGNLVVTGGTVGEVIVWPLRGGPPTTLVKRADRMVNAITFDPTGKKVLIERDRGRDEIVGLDGKDPELVGPEGALKVSVASADWSKRLVQVAPNQLALGDGKTIVAQTERSIPFFKISPHGDTVVVHDGTFVWIAAVGAPLEKLISYDGELTDVTWSPDGKSLLVYGKLPDLYLVDLATHLSKELRGHTDAIYMAQFTADSRGLLTAGDDQTARLWNLTDGSSTPLLGHDDDVYRARFSPNEQLAVTASLDGSIRVWPVPRKLPGVLAEGEPIEELSCSGDSVLVHTEGAVARWQLDHATREQLFAAGPHDGFGIGEPSPDGTKLVVHRPGWVLELRSKDGPPIELRGHKAMISQVEWSRDSRYVYSASYDGTLRRWDATTGAMTLLVHGESPVGGFAVAADGRVAAQTSVDGLMLMIHPDGRQELLGKGPAWCGNKVEFEPVRDRLLIHRCGNGLALVDGDQVVELPTQGYAVSRIAISPDGHLLAGATADRSIRVWRDNGMQIDKLMGHKDLVEDVAFSPDGKELASASYDRTIRIWQLGSDRHRVLRGHSGAVMRIAWRSPHELVSGSHDGTLRLWQVPSLDLPSQAQVTARLDAATTAKIDESTRPTTL